MAAGKLPPRPLTHIHSPPPLYRYARCSEGDSGAKRQGQNPILRRYCSDLTAGYCEQPSKVALRSSNEKRHALFHPRALKTTYFRRLMHEESKSDVRLHFPSANRLLGGVCAVSSSNNAVNSQVGRSSGAQVGGCPETVAGGNWGGLRNRPPANWCDMPICPFGPKVTIFL